MRLPAPKVANVPGVGLTAITFGVAQPSDSPPGGTEIGRVIPTIDNVINSIFVRQKSSGLGEWYDIHATT